MIEQDPIINGEAQITCTGCAMPIPEEVDFCPHCGAPLQPTIWFDPYKRIFAEGYVNRRLSFGQPRPWALMTQIVIVLIVFVSFTILVLSLLPSFRTRTPEIAAIIGLLLLTGGFAMRMIINFRRLSRQHHEAQRPSGGDSLTGPNVGLGTSQE